MKYFRKSMKKEREINKEEKSDLLLLKYVLFILTIIVISIS